MINITIGTGGYDTYEVELEPKKWISVSRKGSTPTRFEIGDTATYDSYNLVYTGEIVQISEKCVTIRPKYETKKTKRLKLSEFCWRNWDFDAEQTALRNSETMTYI
jgi:hypothetical protein